MEDKTNRPPLAKAGELEQRIDNLQKVVVGQTAMIAYLSTILAKKGVLSPLEARLVVMAGVDAQSYEDLNPTDIIDWTVKNVVESIEKVARGQ